MTTASATPVPQEDEEIVPQSRPLSVMVAGLRGLVGVQGGIEMHARMLYPLLARLGCSIEVMHRSPYYAPAKRQRDWHGLTLTYLWSPVRPGLETAVHTLLCVLYAAIRRPDILHLHAIGPGLLAPLARLLGLKVVLTHHAPDYEREKWGALAKCVLRAGERLGVRFATRPIAVSPVIKEDLKMRFGVDVTVIPNGAPHAHPARGCATLDKFGLTKKRYVLSVARIEPAKRQLDLVEAFERAHMPGWKLALVGGATDGDAYRARLLEHANRNTDIVLTGYQEGSALRELYTHAGLFVLPSSVEGHCIALLEAASYGVPIFASAIPANLVVPLPRDRFFPVGNTAKLATMLHHAAVDPSRAQAECQSVLAVLRTEYSWRNAAHMTRSVYAAAAENRRDDHG
jgi:glycosyltransferase involved in cell wall biosynthesis